MTQGKKEGKKGSRDGEQKSTHPDDEQVESGNGTKKQQISVKKEGERPNRRGTKA